MRATVPNYRRPPITECVFEIRFLDACSNKELTRLKDLYSKSYPSVDELRTFQIKIGDDKKPEPGVLVGYKLTSQDATNVLMLNYRSLGVSRLAPYLGWDDLLERSKKNFDIFVKVAGLRQPTRIAARYINRVDIPARMLKDRAAKSFFNVGIAYPSDLTDESGDYSFAVKFMEKRTGADIRLQVGVLEPVLLDHFSFAIDIDASFETDLPIRADGLWTKAEALHEAKNIVFEASITDEARELFK
jgi:uncharacterized protein (TIGR04255 family)